MAAILDFRSEQFYLVLIYKLLRCFLPSFKSVGRFVQKNKRKKNIRQVPWEVLKTAADIRQVPWEVLKTAAEGRDFQHLPRDLANVNALKNHVRSLLLLKK